MRATLAIVFAAAGIALLPAPAQASFCQPNYSCTSTYYSDASKTEVVGRYSVDCRGTVSETGTRTPYSTYNAYLCGHGVG
ncbi:DUF6289 family protein [Nonomuraea purpurea]|uniref:DUF6289 family protein n=1 Tax=Nonomuraea purpurea TaxID=1849276 RepID=A0ABV8G1Z3_9ACTN